MKKVLGIVEGGVGSGFFAHAGRIGLIGGSSEQGGGKAGIPARRRVLTTSHARKVGVIQKRRDRRPKWDAMTIKQQDRAIRKMVGKKAGTRLGE